MATKKKAGARKYGKKASDKVKKTIHELKRGTLRSGSGQKVTSREQAIAIGLSQARKAGGKVPSKGAGAKKKKAGGRKKTAAKGAGRKGGAKRAA